MTVKEIYTLADLKNWKKKSPIRLGVLGDPVAHSLSPQMQNASLEAGKIDMQYGRFQISTDELGEAVKLIRALDFVGANLTAPHKIAACAFMHELDDNATRMEGASIWPSSNERTASGPATPSMPSNGN